MIREDLLKKINNIFSNEEALLGDFILEENDLDEIKNEFINKAKLYQNNFDYSLSDISLFVIVIINQLRDWDAEWDDEGFWQHASDIFDNNRFVDILFGSFRPKLYDAINRLFKKYNRVLFVTSGGNRAFVQTFLYQALAPRDSFKNFVQIAWRKYFNDLDCDYTTSDEAFCEYVINSLARKIKSPEIESDVEFGYHFYRLRKAFKYGILQNKEKTIKLLDRTLLSINLIDRNSEELEDTVFNNIISDVVYQNKRVIERTHGKERAPTSGSGNIHSFNQVRPFLSMDFAQHDRPTIHINFPRVILLGAKQKVTGVSVLLFRIDNNKQTLIKKFPTRPLKDNGEALYTMSAFSLDLTDIYYNEEKDYHYEFVLDPEGLGERYSSGTDFFREYLLFCGEREIRSNCKPGNYYLIAPKSFDPQKNLVLIRPNYRSTWKRIYNIEFDNYDSIQFKEKTLLFSKQGMPSTVVFENQNLLPVDGVALLMNGEEYDFYKTFSNIIITKDDYVSPEAIRILHTIKSLDGNETLNEEIRLSDLRENNHRYLYSCSENKLNEQGIHELMIEKLSDNILGNKYLLNKKYVIDEDIEYKCDKLPYLHGNTSGTIRLFGQTYEYDVSTVGEKSTKIVDENSGATIVIQTPYFRWFFGSNPEEIHYAPFNPKKPLIVANLKSTNETVVIESSFGKLELFYETELLSKPLSIHCGSEENRFLFAKFVNTSPAFQKGNLFCKINGVKIPLFSITDKPYWLGSQELDSCLTLLDDGSLEIDVGSHFIHDDNIYALRLELTDENNNTRYFRITDFNNPGKLENSNYEDGFYTASLSYIKYEIGIESDPVYLIRDVDVELGDINKKAFEDVKEIFLSKKLKGYSINNIVYHEHNNIGYCVFTGFLKDKNGKNQRIKFALKQEGILCDLYYCFGPNVEDKKVNYDKTKNCLTASALSESVEEIRTAYYK